MRPCRWLRDESSEVLRDDGRPRCEHGVAVMQGNGKYACPSKKRERDYRYRRSAKGLRVRIEENQRRWLGTSLLEDALGERERYEASGSTLSFHDWLREFEPLPPLRPLDAVAS